MLEGKLEEEKDIGQEDENWEYACFVAGGEDAWEDVFDKDGNISRELDAWACWTKASTIRIHFFVNCLSCVKLPRANV